MENSFAQRQQALQAQIDKVRETIAGLEAQLRKIDGELEGLSGQRQQYQLLGDVCDSLDKLTEMGSASLFWGEDTPGFDPKARLDQVRQAVAEFRERISVIEQSRQPLINDLNRQQDEIDLLHEHLAEVREAEENAKYDFVIEREARVHPYRASVMPWSGKDEDQRRSRKILLIALLVMLLIGGLPQVWKLPEPDKNKPVEVPERLARMVKKKVPPKPPQKIQEAKKEEKPEDKTAKKEEVKPKETPKATPAEVKQARATAETKGVLAFKNSFSDLMQDDAVPSQMGSDARISNAGNQAPGGAPGSRSLIVAQATGGSGGIASAGISRGGIGNGSGGAITGGGVGIARATSDISNMKSADRPLTKGVGPARTDEEIQIVFDRYKAALYRIYNRELRNDPTLRGKMVLAITIEPDGHVSACKVQSTDLNSPTLSKEIVDRVMRFNFGAKAGVPSTKILYPIDFLPAS